MKTALGLYREEQGKGAAAPLPRTLSPRCRRSVAPQALRPHQRKQEALS